MAVSDNFVIDESFGLGESLPTTDALYGDVTRGYAMNVKNHPVVESDVTSTHTLGTATSPDDPFRNATY
jgi:hypothetical protein